MKLEIFFYKSHINLKCSKKEYYIIVLTMIILCEFNLWMEIQHLQEQYLTFKRIAEWPLIILKFESVLIFSILIKTFEKFVRPNQYDSVRTRMSTVQGRLIYVFTHCSRTTRWRWGSGWHNSPPPPRQDNCTVTPPVCANLYGPNIIMVRCRVPGVFFPHGYDNL